MVNQLLYLHTLYSYTMSRPLSLFNTSLRASSSLRRPVSALPRASVRFLATPSTGPQTVSSGPIKTPHPLDASTKTNADEGSRHVGEQQPGSAAAVKASQAYPDYSKGPSALDKASQLFFFTEIVRGGSLFLSQSCPSGEVSKRMRS
jgi:NADH dehydrogenase (ubiquinone) Fe-S protein 8